MKLDQLLEHVYFGTKIKISYHLSGKVITKFTISELTNFREESLLKTLLKNDVIGIDIDPDNTMIIDII